MPRRSETGRVRAVFFDWHGVLCSQPFWHHLPADHPLNVVYSPRLFADARLLHEWMVGARDQHQALAAHMPARAVHEGLVELRRSCELMRPDPGMAEMFAAAVERADLVAIATDNMDCLAHTWPFAWLDEGSRVQLLCSSNLGALKRDPRRFFDETLEDAGLEPADAVLVDDSAENCSAFRVYGGQAVLFEARDQVSAELHRLGVLDA